MQDTMRLDHIQDLLGQFALLWLWQGKVFSSEAAHLFVWWYPLPVTSPERVQEEDKVDAPVDLQEDGWTHLDEGREKDEEAGAYHSFPSWRFWCEGVMRGRESGSVFLCCLLVVHKVYAACHMDA